MKFTKEMIDKAREAKTEEEFVNTVKSLSSGELADSELDHVVGGWTEEERERLWFYLGLWMFMEGEWEMTEQEGTCPNCHLHTTMQRMEFLCKCTMCQKVFHWKYGYDAPLEAE